MSESTFYAPNPFAVCRACLDTGKNSRGTPCYPCRHNGRRDARRFAVGRRVGKIFSITAGPSYSINALRDYTPKSKAKEYIVLLGDDPANPKPVARWHGGRWQKKKKKEKTPCPKCGSITYKEYSAAYDNCDECIPF